MKLPRKCLPFFRVCPPVLAALMLCSTLPAADAPKPNIVLIFVDDMGYGDLGCYGNSKIKTPNIDRLAREGQRWTSFYSSGSTCVPSRTGLMSGRHPALLGGQKLSASRESLMPAMLKRQGYATAILGKWHLAGYPKDFTKSPMHPLECGFDYHFGTPGSNDVPAPVGKRQTRAVFDACDKFTFQVPLIRGREVVEFPVNQESLTERYTKEAVKWIRSHKDESFFLYMAHNMPHAPVFASPDFQDKSKGGRYGDVVEEIDWSVGQVTRAIAEAGIEKETLVIFTSDNGGVLMTEGQRPETEAYRAGLRPNGQWRGRKHSIYEGGFRVPFLVRWPGRVQPGTVCDETINLVDIYATFAAMINHPMRSDKDVGEDSFNVLPAILGTPHENLLRPSMIVHSPNGHFAIRRGPWKYIEGKPSPTLKRVPRRDELHAQLYNLQDDPGEQNNVIDEHPDVVTRLASLLDEQRTSGRSSTRKHQRENSP